MAVSSAAKRLVSLSLSPKPYVFSHSINQGILRQRRAGRRCTDNTSNRSGHSGISDTKYGYKRLVNGQR